MASSNLHLTNDSVQAWKKSFFITNLGRIDDKASDRRAEVDNERIHIHQSSISSFNNIRPSNFLVGDVTSNELTSNNDSLNCGQILYGRNTDPNMDPRKLKRIISNRVSAQKSRLKKVQYVADMERKLKALEAHIAVLSPQVELYRNQQRLLQMEQKNLNQKIFSFSRTKLVKDAEIEENKAEVNRLRQLHLKLQNQNPNLDNAGWEFTALEQSELMENVVSIHLNQVDDEPRTAGENGLGRFNLTTRHKMVEYRWMPTPGLRQVSEPTSNQLGHQEIKRPN